MPYELARFGFREMMDCRGRIRELLDDDPGTLEEAAERAVEFFHRELVDDRGAPACALVRFFKTHAYRDLPEDLQQVVRTAWPESASVDDLRCLTLVATRGDEPAWNSRHTSRAHRAIPLMSVEMVQQAPMIAQLITQLGLPIAQVVRPSRTLLLDDEQKAHNVFYVPEARDSPYIPAQEEFVLRHGIESAVGFGGRFATGDLFAVVLFSKAFIGQDIASNFRTLALTVKTALLSAGIKAQAI